jgi:non-heme chloroperoxidase
VGHDYDTFAADLNPPLEHLDLTGVVLGGFTVGTGEVTRRLARYGSGRVAKAVMFGGSRRSCSRPITIPGASTSSIRETKASIVKDQYAPSRFPGQLLQHHRPGRPRADQRLDLAGSLTIASGTSPYATYACVDAWLTGFRANLSKIDVPTLVMHGTEDRILPYQATAARLPGLTSWAT